MAKIVTYDESYRDPTFSINLEELQEEETIVEYALERGMDLYAQHGGDYTACCPFHEEDTPSFRIYSVTNSFYCFGCQQGGSIFDFIMKFDGVDFKKAIEILGGKQSEFDLSGLKVKKQSEYDKVREKLETYATRRLRKLYQIRKLVPGTTFDTFDGLWNWYDDTQLQFDINAAKGVPEDILSQKLYEWYEVFNRRAADLQYQLEGIE